MPVKKIDVPEIGVVHLYKRRKAKSMRLSVTHSGDIRVSLPYWVSYRMGIEFAQKRSDWLLAHKPLRPTLQSGLRVGKAHRLLLLPGDNSRISTRLNGGEVKVMFPHTLHSDHSTVQKAVEQAIIRALKLEAETLLPQRLRSLTLQHGFTYKSVTIKRLSSRWGSCSNEHDITLNCYLMQLPWHLIDYVLLHELVHTRVMAHGPAFWAELSRYVADVKNVRKEIRQYQPNILIT